MRGFARWSPAIFWCLAAGCFGLCLELGGDLEKLALAIGIAVIAGSLAVLALPLSIASAGLAGFVLFELHPAFASIALLWAASAAALARIRSAIPIEKRAPADLATCFGAGYTPRGSGTAGAVTAIPIGWLLSRVDDLVRVGILAALSIAAIGVSYWYMAGRTDDLDPKEVVLDEHVGVLIAFAVVPWEWPYVAGAFILFRLFDIWKPWPVGWLDRKVKNPAGVMLDDYAAGLMAAAASVGIRWLAQLAAT